MQFSPFYYYFIIKAYRLINCSERNLRSFLNVTEQVSTHRYKYIMWWSRGSVLAFSTQVCGFKPGRSRRIFRAKKSSARLPSEGK